MHTHTHTRTHTHTMINSIFFEFFLRSHCHHFTVPGGLVMSPIEVTNAPLTVQELQKNFYKSKPLFRVRRGPASLDEDRLASTVDYETPAGGYPYPVSLVAPPILLQSRRTRTTDCDYMLASEYNAKIWDTAVSVTCHPPYSCSEDVMTNPTSLMACSSKDSPSRFFGKEPILVGGRPQFFEFLQSIVDTPFLVRDNAPKSTRAFLDSQTDSISCVLIAYSNAYGIVSTIRINADVSADVKVDYTVTHFQSLEGEDLTAYTRVAILAFVLSTILLVEKVVTVRSLDWHEVREAFAFDVLIQVVLPVLYFGIRLAQIIASKDNILNTIGMKGLAGVPWVSREVSMPEKVAAFFDSLNKLEALNSMEQSMGIFYFVFSTAQLLRLIGQTSAHPRTAILVHTLREGMVHTYVCTHIQIYIYTYMCISLYIYIYI